MSGNIANIMVKGLKKGKPKLKSDLGMILNFYQSKSTLKNLETYNKFIKAVEKLVRTSDEYRTYINYLKEEIGLSHCMVLSNITDEDAPIEMHHGPILTLYDCCCIVVDHCLNNGEDITTFMVADIIIREHFLNNIQVVMLCETVHRLVHAGEVYINIRQAWGNLNAFIEKYSDGVDDNMKEIIQKNIEIARNFHSTDNGLLELNKKVKNWAD